MTNLTDGIIDSLDRILSSEPIEPELDEKGSPKPINWKLTLDNAKDGGAIASAKVGDWTYNIELVTCRVSAVKLPHTLAEVTVKANPVVVKANTQIPKSADTSKVVIPVAEKSVKVEVTPAPAPAPAPKVIVKDSVEK